MSDLSATNCGCGCDSGNGLFGGSNSCLWIIILLFCCGGCGGNGFGKGGDCGGNDSCLWIILLLLFCGGNDCGCGC
ncbi:MAG: chorion class high-cysteine HCB protein 13 [Hespellia sp.]|nr:chorion class high-cysteine HCB protein 13 [Hespellia sp.]